MKIIVGLGNPLPKYKNTRHNVGQMIVSAFQKINNFPEFKLKKKLESLISEGKIGEQKIILALPQTFMNESGRAIKEIIRNLLPPVPQAGEAAVGKLEIRNLIIVHDDIDLPLGKIRIKKDGSSGGHRGIQSIIDCLKTENFIRLKIGINHPLKKIRVAAFGLPASRKQRRALLVQKFVLEKFEIKEKEIINKVKEKTIEIIGNLISKKEIQEQTFSV